jgi:CRISPR system Cascade subunit CasC
MKKLVELHILQNFAPSNLNRDDTGSPKDALFGGVRRARISSQCLKRAMRTYFRASNLIEEGNLALRTKRVTQALVGKLEQLGRSAEEAERVAVAALGGVKLQVKDGKSEYLLFLGEQEVARIARLVDEHWDTLLKAAKTEGDGEKKRSKDAKEAAKGAIPADLARAIGEALDGGKAVDVALFGRMLADVPNLNRDAAAQVAHAISTHKVEREFDFYTAVDDLQPDDTSGADMLGTVEFNSACYYRYAAIDIEKLVENLQGDKELALKGIEAFLQASVYAEPAGKQNTFAAHSLPGFIAFTVRQDASPRSLANAFEKPTRAANDGLIAPSVQALAREWARLEAVFGQDGRTLFVNTTEARAPELPGQDVENVRDLIGRTVQHIAGFLEG